MDLPLTFPAQLRKVQAAQEDFEWYPTTDEIIQALVKDLRSIALSGDRTWNRHQGLSSGFLDIGAGNGKVIDAVRKWDIRSEDNRRRQDGHVGPFYAIEKSHTLLNLLDPKTYILGCDFWNTSLHDKSVGYIFSNPPYRQFKQWTSKILREAPAQSIIWLVIPERWEKDSTLAAEIKIRNATTKIIGSFDFADAEDRKARAKVHLIRITLPQPTSRYGIEDEGATDPFTRFFNETFTFAEEEEEEETKAKKFEDRLEETKVVHRLNFIEALCHLYDLRMAELQRNYQAICDISPDILKEFDISKAGLISSLKMKLATCKKEYWQRLFDGMSEINSRLTTTSRKAICELMQSQTGIEFNRENAYAIVLWVVKNANQYFDSQLIETYENLVNKASVENYVSNKRVFTWNRFAYRHCKEEDASHYRLKIGHRMVITHCGGISTQYSSSRDLCETARNFISDLATVANNLGFNGTRTDVAEYAPSGRYSSTVIKDSTPFVIRYNPAPGKWESLMRIRAFENGNLHIQFLPEFIHALNIQHGKLKGWLRNDAQAATELEIPQELAARHFKPGFRLEGSSLALMAPADEAAA